MASFGLLHGAWHDSSCWEPVGECLEELGHEAIVPELPLHDPKAGYETRVRPALEALAELDGDVVVVPHSQSSGLGTMVAASRRVRKLIYLCPRMGGIQLPDGAPAPFRDGFPFPASQPDGTSAWEPEAARTAMYSRLSSERAEALIEHLRPMAMPPDDYPLQEQPDVPAALIYGAEDELLEPAFERFVARELLGVEPIQIPCGHFPMAESPAALAELLDEVVERDRHPLELERVLPATPEEVFAAFTEPRTLAHWWGPAGFEIPRVELEAREGAGYRIEMQPPEGDPFFLAGTFREVNPPERLAFTFAWEEPDPDDVENLVELDFVDRGDSTYVGLTQAPFKTKARRGLHRDGWSDSFEKLAYLLAAASLPS